MTGIVSRSCTVSEGKKMCPAESSTMSEWFLLLWKPVLLPLKAGYPFYWLDGEILHTS
jgi:hypothetical protein